MPPSRVTWSPVPMLRVWSGEDTQNRMFFWSPVPMAVSSTEAAGSIVIVPPLR
uniref:Unannotated protein n=1 Tax=freshwater metagenome TaxID=449393 RepID=A0A6J7NVG6_9ZZZZ